MEQRQQNTNNNNPKENIHTLRHLFAKLDKQEVTNFGNYCVNFNEMFPKEEESKDYFKNHVSLFNDNPVHNEPLMGASINFVLPKYFDNLEEKTLFYIFYFMPRDTLQLHAGYNLFRKGWLYNYKFQIWFKKNKEIDKWIYFNPLEWKKNEYNFGPIDTQHFLQEEEYRLYIDPKDKKKKGHRSGSNNINNMIMNNMNNNTNGTDGANPNNGQVNNYINNNQKNDQKNNNNTG